MNRKELLLLLFIIVNPFYFLINRELLGKGQSTYKKAGVDLDAASHFIRIIKQFVESTQRTGCIGTIGGFGGLFDLRDAGYIDPLLVSGTDGVGTKLKVKL